MGGIDLGELTGFIVIASGAAVLGMSYFAAYLLGKNAARKEMDRRDFVQQSARTPDRMDQIEAAVESIAVEVERIAEGQRFLLGSRAASQPVQKVEARKHKTPV